MKILMALFCGVIFGLGLALSGMTDVSRVIGFLDLLGNWDPTLAFVMGGGIFISLPFFQIALAKFKAPLLETEFSLPNSTNIDMRLVGGAALFGIGWGLVGLCPGPAIASIAYLNADIFSFIAAMMMGMFAMKFIEELLSTNP